MRATVLLCPLAALALGAAGCHDHRCDEVAADMPIFVNHCPSYTYVKDSTDEGQLLADEKKIRGMDGVADVRTRMGDTASAISVTVHRGEDDIAVREELLGLGYHRRW